MFHDDLANPGCGRNKGVEEALYAPHELQMAKLAVKHVPNMVSFAQPATLT